MKVPQLPSEQKLVDISSAKHEKYIPYFQQTETTARRKDLDQIFRLSCQKYYAICSKTAVSKSVLPFLKLF